MTIGKAEVKPTNAGKQIILTARDRALLADIDRFRFLSTDQIAALHFHSVHRTRKRMRKLWLHGFVNRIVQPVLLGEGSEQYLYTVTSLSRLLAGMARKRQKPRRVNKHALEINTFHICLEMALAGKPVQLQTWKDDGSLVVPVGGKGVSIVPDGFFTLQKDQKRLHYFLEVDRGTADLARIKQKLLRYLNLWNHRHLVPIEHFQSFRVLYITPSNQRTQSILQLLRAFNKNFRRDLIVVTDITKYSVTAPVPLFTPIWQIIDCFGQPRVVAPLPSLHSGILPPFPGNAPVERPALRPAL